MANFQLSSTSVRLAHPLVVTFSSAHTRQINAWRGCRTGWKMTSYSNTKFPTRNKTTTKQTNKTKKQQTFKLQQLLSFDPEFKRKFSPWTWRRVGRSESVCVSEGLDRNVRRKETVPVFKTTKGRRTSIRHLPSFLKSHSGLELSLSLWAAHRAAEKKREKKKKKRVAGSIPHSPSHWLKTVPGSTLHSQFWEDQDEAEGFIFIITTRPEGAGGAGGRRLFSGHTHLSFTS